METRRWGRVYEDAKWRTRQLLYLSEQVLCRITLAASTSTACTGLPSQGSMSSSISATLITGTLYVADERRGAEQAHRYDGGRREGESPSSACIPALDSSLLLRSRGQARRSRSSRLVLQPRTAAAEVIRQFDEGKSNKHIKPYQTIFHPGEVRAPLALFSETCSVISLMSVCRRS